jgi:hypothetical protein
MDAFSIFAWIETSALSVWVRESPSLLAFPTVLIFHTIGMAFLAGGNIAVDLRVLGFAARVPLSMMERFFPIMTLAFFVNALSGVLLLIAYPTKALTNPLFYVKLALIALAVLDTRWLTRNVLRNPSADDPLIGRKARLFAAVSLILWIGAIGAGRFLAYTYTYLMAGE